MIAETDYHVRSRGWLLGAGMAGALLCTSCSSATSGDFLESANYEGSGKRDGFLSMLPIPDNPLNH